MALCSYVPGAVSAIRQVRGAGINAAIVSGDAMDGHYWAEGVPGLSDHYAVPFDPEDMIWAAYRIEITPEGGLVASAGACS